MPDSSRPRKRQRISLSCTECRRRKVRCDHAKPHCGPCRALNLVEHCIYQKNRRVAVIDKQQSQQHVALEQSRHTATPADPGPSSRITGVVSKSRVFGHGHWMNTMSLMEGLPSFEPIGATFETLRGSDEGVQNEVTETVAQCKQLARIIKRQRPSRKGLPPDVQHILPDRVILEQLVELYFDTFEFCYGILDHPSLMAGYERFRARPEHTDSVVTVQLLLVTAIAGPLHSDANVRRDLAIKSRLCVDIAQTWLSAPLEKNRFTLGAVQVHCLLLLARQVNQIGADLVWTSAGTLLRMAMQVGLHQDPDLLGNMDVRQKGLRRRLWYTILEINVQSALDSGMPPMISTGDYNTKPPADPEDGEPTQTVSFQNLLAKALPLRLQVTKAINEMLGETPYDQVLELGNELVNACRDAAASISRTTPSGTFASSFCSHLLGRFTLCLHYRFAVKAKTNPLYAYFQQAALESTLDLISLLEDEPYNRVLCTGGGMFRDIITRGALLIFLEIVPAPESETSIFAKRRNRAHRESMLREARRLVQYARDRIFCGDMNIKLYVWPRMMVAQAEALLDELPVDEAIARAMHEGLNECHAILREVAASASGVVPGSDPGFWASNPVSPPDLDFNFDSDFDGLNNEIFGFDFANADGLAEWIGA
ncbi:hypothetical protein BJY04DRAFT_230200 [Aspergillus karnatakaensis]|uniref:putative C6 transcription factor n=1 Tax=Aspergillus karnatakaensis TaxID=1810916 RepID=UPI003CCE23DE